MNVGKKKTTHTTKSSGKQTRRKTAETTGVVTERNRFTGSSYARFRPVACAHNRHTTYCNCFWHWVVFFFCGMRGYGEHFDVHITRIARWENGHTRYRLHRTKKIRNFGTSWSLLLGTSTRSLSVAYELSQKIKKKKNNNTLIEWWWKKTTTLEYRKKRLSRSSGKEKNEVPATISFLYVYLD